jgi:hypothetical protein
LAADAEEKLDPQTYSRRSLLRTREESRVSATERWVYPFAITLAASLVFFALQMAEYTALLG